jgi:hypothetical protein
MRKLTLVALTLFAMFPTPAAAETTFNIKGKGKDLQAVFDYQLPCTNPVTGEAGVATYNVYVTYLQNKENSQGILSGEFAFGSIGGFDGCTSTAHNMAGATDDFSYPNAPRSVKANISSNLKDGNIYSTFPVYDSADGCYYQMTMSVNLQAVSKSENFAETFKLINDGQTKVISHANGRQVYAKATGEVTLKPLVCIMGNQHPSTLNNYTPVPSSLALIRDNHYVELTILKK